MPVSVTARRAREGVVQRRYSMNCSYVQQTGPLVFVTIDILWRFLKMRAGNGFIVLMTYMFRKVEKTAPTTKPTATTVATTFVNDWAANFGTRPYVLLGNGPKFKTKVFQAI